MTRSKIAEIVDSGIEEGRRKYHEAEATARTGFADLEHPIFDGPQPRSPKPQLPPLKVNTENDGE